MLALFIRAFEYFCQSTSEETFVTFHQNLIRIKADCVWSRGDAKEHLRLSSTAFQVVASGTLAFDPLRTLQALVTLKQHCYSSLCATGYMLPDCFSMLHASPAKLPSRKSSFSSIAVFDKA